MDHLPHLFRRLCFCFGLAAVSGSSAAAASYETAPGGAIIPLRDGLLKITFREAGTVRVCFGKNREFFDRQSLVTVPTTSPVPQISVREEQGHLQLQSDKLSVDVDLKSGALAFRDSQGKPLLREQAGGRVLEPMELQGEKSFHVRQLWEENEGEALYGLGQHQLGLLNLKGYDIDLWQRNTTVIVPFLVSSRGYGILWDNSSYTRFGDTRPFEFMPASVLRDAEGKPGALTGSYFADAEFGKLVATRRDSTINFDVRDLAPLDNVVIHGKLPAGDVSIRWEGSIVPEQSGDYLLDSYAAGGLRVWVDDKLVLDHWRQEWLPATDAAKVSLKAGHSHKVRIDWLKNQKAAHCKLRWKTPSSLKATSLWSEMADGIDYTFILGPDLDQVVAGYRRLTGAAPLMPRWAFGLWQSRQRYETAQQVVDIVDGFRKRQIPFDVIVQDWQYWAPGTWGSHLFDATRFPDPVAWTKAIHERNARVMISVWCKFYPGTENFEELRAEGLLYESNLRDKQKDWLGFPFTFVDIFSEKARKVFWGQMERQIFSKGVDAWWMDASEPDMLALPTLDGIRNRMTPTALGAGARYLNAYALEVARAVYEGQRKAAPGQRVFNLTRSGFAGQQRFAAATWSGDTSSTWTAMSKQIQAGLGFSISGVPYWTMDSGGFVVPDRFQKPEGADEWAELNTRWFQFATFTPILRVHGEYPFREMWEFGGENSPAYAAQLKYDRLRYHLLPYIYSLAGAVTFEGHTFMRPLAMDFPADPRALDCKDAFLFGHELLVAPVTEYKAREKQVYLPATKGGWYNLWTGAQVEGGREITADAPFSDIPVFAKAGAILPCGPIPQHTAEKPSASLTLLVFTGADGAFTLYEDDGLSYEYEKGACSQIPLHWNESSRTLEIGARQGSFPGMLAERDIEIVLIEKDKPQPFSFEHQAKLKLHYSGQPLRAELK